jgi:NDP-sugar pyrophosphorylase family protein
MKIIIPMTGYGSRFVNAGYKELKPLIRVQGKPIVQWIVQGMYNSDDNFLFICRKEHLENFPHMEKMLMEMAPQTEIYAIDEWLKKGPVYDVLRSDSLISDDEPCIINYCDFYTDWSYYEFKQGVREHNCDGSVPCHTGFHPHLLENIFATCKTDEQSNLIEIREKFSFERDRTKSKNSDGVYYFKTGSLLKYYGKQLVGSGNTINGEYYVSLIYNFMVQDGLKIWVPIASHTFCHWGAPESLEDYLFWINLIKMGR